MQKKLKKQSRDLSNEIHQAVNPTFYRVKDTQEILSHSAFTTSLQLSIFFDIFTIKAKRETVAKNCIIGTCFSVWGLVVWILFCKFAECLMRAGHRGCRASGEGEK